MQSGTGDTSHGINWMLHNGQVSDEDLAQVLIEEYYENLYRFAFCLTLDEDQAGRNARKSIVNAVEERHRFWNQTSLNAWLFSLVIKSIDSSRFKWGMLNYNRQKNKSHLDGPDHSLQVYLRLRLEEGLSPSEIAFIFLVTESQVKNSLELAYREIKTAVEAPAHPSEEHGHIRSLLHTQRAAGLSEEEGDQLDRDLRECDSCRRYALVLEEAEAHWMACQPQPVGIDGNELEKAFHRVKAVLSNENGRVWKKLPVRELFLIGLLAFVLYLFGLNMGAFDEYDARPTLTAIPTPVSMQTPSPRLMLKDGEETDYFYYSYDRDNETVEQIAELAGISVNALEYINLGINYGSQSTIRLVAFQTDDRFHPDLARVQIPSSSPITALSSPEEVITWASKRNNSDLSRMTASLYIEYGNFGFSGVPAVYLSLVAESGPDHWVLIHETYRQKNTLSVVRASDMLFSRSDQREWFGTKAEQGYADLKKTFTVALNLPDRDSVRVVKEDYVADRSTVLLEMSDLRGEVEIKERFWIDRVTGQVLRYELYGGPDGNQPIGLYLVTTVLLDNELPDWLFYPGSYQDGTLENLGFWNDLDELVAAFLRYGPQSAY
jgi:hypothetical protein